MLNSYLTKINSSWIKDLNICAKTIKSLEENIGIRVHNLGFLDMAPNLKATKEKKLDLINIKNFCASKDTNKKMKR